MHLINASLVRRVSHADSSPWGPTVNQNVAGMQIIHDNILKEYRRNFKKNLARDENVTFFIPDYTGLYWLIITANNLKNSYI